MFKMKVKLSVKMVMMVMRSMANQVKNNLICNSFCCFFSSFWICKSHSSVFLLIVNVQISSRRPSFEIQSIQALRQVLGQKHHTPGGIESSLGFFCKNSYCQIKGNLNLLFFDAPQNFFLRLK